MCARRWIGRASPGRAGARGSLISAPSSQSRVTAMAVGSGTAELGGGVTVAPRGGAENACLQPHAPRLVLARTVSAWYLRIRLHAFHRQRRQADPSRSFHRVEERIIFSRLRFCVCVCARRSAWGARDPAGEYAAQMGIAAAAHSVHHAGRKYVAHSAPLAHPSRSPSSAPAPSAFLVPAHGLGQSSRFTQHGEGRRRCTQVGLCCARPRSRDKFAPGSAHGKRNRLARIRTTARRIVLCIMIMMLQMCAMDMDRPVRRRLAKRGTRALWRGGDSSATRRAAVSRRRRRRRRRAGNEMK